MIKKYNIEKQYRESKKSKFGSLKGSTKMDKSLAKLTKTKREETQITKTRNENGNITINVTRKKDY